MEEEERPLLLLLLLLNSHRSTVLDSEGKVLQRGVVTWSNWVDPGTLRAWREPVRVGVVWPRDRKESCLTLQC